MFSIQRNANQEAMNTQLWTQLYTPEDNTATATDNAAWSARQTPFLRSQRVELIGKLRADVFQVHGNLLLLDNVGLRVKLTVASQKFFLWSKTKDPDVEFIIQDCELLLKFYQVAPELSLAIEKMLLSHPAVFRYKSTELKTFVHPSVSQIISVPVAVSGRLPTSLFITFCKTTDFSGTYDFNPYSFDHHSLEELSIFVNGVEKRYTMDFKAPHQCSSILRALYQDCGLTDEDSGSNFYTIPRLKNGNFAVSLDLTVDSSGYGESRNLDVHGCVRIQGRLKTVLPNSIMVLVLAEYDSVFEINSAREVTVY